MSVPISIFLVDQGLSVSEARSALPGRPGRPQDAAASAPRLRRTRHITAAALHRAAARVAPAWPMPAGGVCLGLSTTRRVDAWGG